ncbi:hypothetical protein TNCV_329331 [Trichonephila clavipes]|nr:hypothetical protein TNCV_329331 [Trichonephila clavipes]
MLDEGIVQPSESPWSSPIVLEAGLKLNSKKCLFAAQEVKILSHLVSSNGVRPDPDKNKSPEVDEIAKFLLEEIVLRHGAPRVIITDRGAVFRSRLVSLSSTCVTLIIVSQRCIIPKQMD